MLLKFEFLNKGVKLSCDGSQIREEQRRWTYLTIKLYLSHFPRLDRPEVPLFAASKWFQKSFYYYHCSISCISALELPARSRSWTARNSVKKQCFFVAYPVNIFRPRRFEDTSKLLCANMSWTSESSEIFFFSIRTKLWAMEEKEQNIILELFFSFLDSIFTCLHICVMFLLYSEH